MVTPKESPPQRLENHVASSAEQLTRELTTEVQSQASGLQRRQPRQPRMRRLSAEVYRTKAPAEV